MKKITSLLLTLVFILCALPLGIAADETSTHSASSIGSIDIALLLDVSGSMESADPNVGGSRMSTDVAGMFSTWMPTLEMQVRIKLIPYSTNVYDGFDPVYSNEKMPDGSGKTRLGEQLKQVVSDTIPGFSCYDGMTNIGGAMKVGTQFLTSSDADKKVMILFTDGKLEMSTSTQTNQSKQDANTSRDTLKAMGADIFCVGLDVSANGSNLDKSFLQSMAGSSDGVLIAKDRNKLEAIFAQLTALIFPDDHVDATPEPSVTIGPDIPVTKKFWVYKDIVNETLFSLKCSAKIKQIVVKDPYGNVVADMNYAEGKYVCDTSVCDISISYNELSATVRLLRPNVEGDWEITMTSKSKGEVSLSKINYYDLELQDNVSVSQVFVGNTLNIDAIVFNKITGSQVKSEKFFVGDTAAKAILYVRNTFTQTMTPYTGVLNSARNGYEFSISFDKPGTYELEIIGNHEQFTPKSSAVKTVEVVAPAIEVGVANSGVDETKNVTVTMLDPTSGKKVSAVPSYLAEQTVKVTVMQGDNVVFEQSFRASEMKNGEKTLNAGALAPGSYTAKAQITGYDIDISSKTVSFSVLVPTLSTEIQKDTAGRDHKINVTLIDPETKQPIGGVPSYMDALEGILTIMSGDKKIAEQSFKTSDMTGGVYTYVFSSTQPGDYTVTVSINGGDYTVKAEQYSFTLEPSKVSVGSGVESEIEYSGLKAEYSQTVSIDKLFSDSDGDPLSITVSVDNENVLSAELDGTELNITLKDFGTATITIKATDGKGASAIYEIKVVAESTMGILIAIIVAVLVLIIAIIIFIVARNKSKVIQISFKIKVSKDAEGSVKEAVYKINRLAANKYAKPTMDLATLLSESATFAEKERSSFAAGELEVLVSGLSGVTVTGQPFKKSFDVAMRGKKRATYKKSQVSVDVADLGCTLSFGSISDFADGGDFGSSSGGYSGGYGSDGGFGSGGFDGGFSF